MKKGQEVSFTRWIMLTLLTSTVLIGFMLACNTGVFVQIRTNADYREIATTTSVNVAHTLESINDDNFVYDTNEGVLKKGDIIITDEAFKKSLAFNPNIYHTIFWKDTRVLTDVVDDKGNSVVGTKLTDDKIRSAIVRDGIYNANNVKIYGEKYTVCYYPLKNGNETVGYVFTGVKQAEASKHILIDSGLTVVIAIIYTVVIMLIFAKLIKKKAIEFDDNLTKAAEVANEKKTSVTELGMQTNANMDQINVAINQMSQAVTSQASHTQEIMGTMEAFGNNIDGIMGQVSATSQITREGTVLMNELENELVSLEAASKANSDEIDNICNQIDDDVKAVTSIEKIVKVIDDISFQITILSFNASVEAARAGEAGRGFAVVAESIKELSDKTQISVNEISAIIKSVDDQMIQTGQASKELQVKNERLIEELAETKSRLSSVTEAFAQIAGNITRVQEESESIIVAKDQVVSTVSSLAASSEENAAMSEEIAATSNIVIDTTQNLIGEIKQLQTIIDTVEKVKKDFI